MKPYYLLITIPVALGTAMLIAQAIVHLFNTYLVNLPF